MSDPFSDETPGAPLLQHDDDAAPHAAVARPAHALAAEPVWEALAVWAADVFAAADASSDVPSSSAASLETLLFLGPAPTGAPPYRPYSPTPELGAFLQQTTVADDVEHAQQPSHPRPPPV